MAFIPALIALAGTAISAAGQRKSAKEAKKQGRVFRGFDIKAAQRRERVASRLESLAEKMLNDEPLSGQERELINSARTIATKGIKQARKEAQEGALGAQAATGFLKSGRTAEQLRRINIEGGEAQHRVELAREQAVANAIRQRQQTAFGLLSASAGIQPVQFQQFQQPLQSQSILGAGLTSVGGALLERQAQQAAIQAQQDSAKNLRLNDVQKQTEQASIVAQQQPFKGFGTTDF